MRRNKMWAIYWRLDKRFWVTMYLAVLLAVAWWAYGDPGKQIIGRVSEIVTRLVWEDLFAFAEWNESSLADIFAASIPLWPVGDLTGGDSGAGYEGGKAGDRGDIAGPGQGFSLTQAVIGIKPGQPESYLAKGVPLFSGYYRRVVSEAEAREAKQVLPGGTENPGVGLQTSDSNAPETDSTSKAQAGQQVTELTDPGQQPAVFIYNTHTGENYAYPRGLVKVPGKRGGVVDVAGAIKKRLEEYYKVKVIQSETIHDSDWLHSNPYGESLQTAQKQIKATPTLQIVLDVHRDAQVPRENTVIKINGKSVARIMLVVGTNARNNNPNWLKNYRFAQELGKELDKKYPGLLRKIITKRGRYNQHLHPRAILVEIGSTENTTAEASAAGELLADVLAKMLTKAD